MTLADAQRVSDLRNSLLPAGTPLRYRPQIVALPDDNTYTYTVMTCGEAASYEIA